MTGLGVALGLASAAVFGLASVVQAGAVRDFDDEADRLTGFVARAVRDARSWIVVAAYLLGFALHAAAIWLLPLYLAQATIAMQLPVTAVLSGRVEDALDRGRWLAVLVVTAGLVLLTLGAGDAGDVAVSARFAVIAWAGVVVLAVLALPLATRGGGSVGGSRLGLLAGAGYAGSAIAVRGVGDPTGGSLVTIAVTALAVPAYGVVAFWLYSVAMRRARVAVASAALIVVQTFVPAAVGVVLLGDEVRSGWWPSVVAGLLLATAGAVALSREMPSARTTSEVATPG